MGKVFTEHTENKKDAILRIRDDGIRKDGVCVPTASADNPCNTEFLIDRLSMNDIDHGTLVGGMNLTVTGRATAWTGFCFRLKRSHEIKEQRFR